MTRAWPILVGVVLLACGGPGLPDGGTPDAGSSDAGPDAGLPDAGTPDAGAECDQALNAARRAALVASQPALGVRSRAVITATVRFPSALDGSTSLCPVELAFRDSSGDLALQPYEDWTRGSAERAQDLLARLTPDQKLALLAMPAGLDLVSPDAGLSGAMEAALDAGVRFGLTAANDAGLVTRATWANAIQARCEASALGLPFVLASEPAHSEGAGRHRAKGFSRWPLELGLAAGGDAGVVEGFGRVVAAEYRAIGVTLALGLSADLATEPRWPGVPFTLGEDAATVSSLGAALVRGLQGGATPSPAGVAAVVGHFPGAGPAAGGRDARLATGQLLAYPGGALDAHLAAFQGPLGAGVAGVMTGLGIPGAGSWTALGGMLDGSSLEQVGASFNGLLVTGALRARLGFGGLVLAPRGALEDAGAWGLGALTRAQRLGRAVAAGVDQFVGLEDPGLLAEARSAGLLSGAQLDAAAGRALRLMFQLGLFEDPYVDAAQAPRRANTDQAYWAGQLAMDQGLVLLVNSPKPAGWLNGNGDGTQVGDAFNAGNGSGRVLPAPPGNPYWYGARYFVGGGALDLAYVRSVAVGYGEPLNDLTVIDGAPVSSDAERMAAADYILLRLAAPCAPDPDSGPLGLCLPSLEYGSSAASAALLQPLRDARAALDAHPGSRAQIIVFLDATRPMVVSEVLALGVSGLYLDFGVNEKALLDVAFGIIDGTGRLPVGVPRSDAAAAAQLEDLPGDGQHPTFVRGFGLQTRSFGH